MMQPVKTTSAAKMLRFFGGKCLDILRQRGIKENAQRWYVKRAGAFVRAAQGRKLLGHTVADVSHYLEK